LPFGQCPHRRWPKHRDVKNRSQQFQEIFMVLSTSITRHLLAVWASTVLLASATHAQTAAPPASAFESYKPYTDEPIGNWKSANDTAARIGGWREYAKQVQQVESKPKNMSIPVTKVGETPPEPTKKAKP